MKVCNRCGKKKEITDFYRNKRTKNIGGDHMKDNVRIICAECNNHRPRKGQDIYL